MAQLQVKDPESENIALENTASSFTHQELLSLLGKQGHKKNKKIWVAVIVAVITLLAFGGWLMFGRANKAEAAVTYRQYTAAIGDVVVGSTESSSISLNRETIKFPVSTTVEEIFVKPGVSVQKGEPLMRLNVEQIEAGLITYQLQVKMAQLELEQARLDQQSKQLKAEQTYKTAILAGVLAESNQEISIATLEKQLADAQQNLEDALEDLDTYRNYQDNYDDDYSDLTSLSSRVSTYKTNYTAYYEAWQNVVKWELELAQWQTLKTQRISTYGEDSEEVAECKAKISALELKIADALQENNAASADALNNLYENAYSAYKSLQSKYTERLADFNDEYDIDYDDDKALSDKITSLKEKVASYNLALQTAKNSQQTGTMTAEQAKQLSELSAQTAQAQYNLTTLRLSQTVDEAQETYDQTVRQIDAISKSISNDGIVYAPCTGMIVNISLEEGDDFEVTYNEDTDTLNEKTLLVMTDISSVFVPITISEEDILNVYIGQKARVTMNAFEGQTFEAEVDTISVEASRSGAATVSYTVNIKYAEENKLNMYEGMSAQTTLLQRVAVNVLYINNQAVTNLNGVSTVQKRNTDGTTQTVTIKTGFSNGQYVEVLEGLEEGDIVLAASGVGRT